MVVERLEDITVLVGRFSSILLSFTFSNYTTSHNNTRYATTVMHTDIIGLKQI